MDRVPRHWVKFIGGLFIGCGLGFCEGGIDWAETIIAFGWVIDGPGLIAISLDCVIDVLGSSFIGLSAAIITSLRPKRSLFI